MDVLYDERDAPDNESGYFFAFSNSSQPLNQYTLPLPLGQYFVVHAPTEVCSRVSHAPLAMPVSTIGTIFHLVPCLNCSQTQIQTGQFDCQDIGLGIEYFPCNPSKPQTTDDYISMSTASSQPLQSTELPTITNSGILTSGFDSPTMGTQTQHTASSFATNTPAYPPMPEESQTLQPSPSHRHSKSTCHECDCGATFKRASDLKRHVATVHGQKQECPYSYCQYRTGRKDKMLEHARKMHGKH